MGKMCRLRSEAAAAFALQEAFPVVLQAAQQQGLPINDATQQMLRNILHQGLHAGLTGLQSKYGIFVGIADDSRYFQHFGAYALAQGATNIRPIANVQPAPVAQPAAPVFVQPAAAPVPAAPNPWAGHSHIPPPPPTAIMPGQPLPPMAMPPGPPAHAPMPAGAGTRPIAPHAVPVHAPVMNGDHPPSLTQMPNDPTPTIN